MNDTQRNWLQHTPDSHSPVIAFIRVAAVQVGQQRVLTDDGHVVQRRRTEREARRARRIFQQHGGIRSNLARECRVCGGAHRNIKIERPGAVRVLRIEVHRRVAL
jgi:hypothetical protein